jgi:hypothetical protein
MKRLAASLALLNLVSALPCLAAEPARQADMADPGQFQCVGRNRFSGLANVPVEKHGENVSWDYAAFFTDPVHGTPIIVYGPRFREVSPLMQAFIRRHECQHANGVVDEITANCLALRQMRVQGLTPPQEAELARWHLAQGRLDPQYGSSGVAFWERTLQCAASVR